MTGGIEKEKGDKVEGNRIITMHVLGEEQETEKEYKGFGIFQVEEAKFIRD